MDLVGLIHAAGKGTRLSPLPCSKELFPVGFARNSEQAESHPKVVSQYLLDLYKKAGAQQVYFILRDGKWDIPAYYGDGSQLGHSIAYLMMNRLYGTPFSLDQAYPFVKDKQVLFGFPDILVEPEDAFLQLLQKQTETQADVVLGSFQIAPDQKWDVLETDATGKVVAINQRITDDTHKVGWALATWGPKFTAFMHDLLEREHEQMLRTGSFKELSVGHVLSAALSNGLQIQSVYFSAGRCQDIGTPENLRQAVRSLY